MVRDDGAGALDFDWGAGSPSAGCGVPSDGFSVRWTRTAAFEGGTYVFTASADDGLRVKVGATTVFDEWRDQVASFRKELVLPAGEHTITVEHYENGGGATAKLDWQRVATTLIDDPELLVTSTGKMEWWHRETGVGHESDLVWTLNTYSRRDNYARWTPSLPAPGWYLVEAFIPSFNSSKATTRARYSVVAKGRTYTGLEVDQSAGSGKWVALGTFEFDGSGNRTEYVELGDVTGETSVSRNVLFDAVRLTPSAPPAPDGGWAFPVGSADSGAGWSVVLGLGQSWTSASGTQYNGHLAEDWSRAGGSLGQPVYAAAEGRVIINLQNCGNYVDVVILEHSVQGFSDPIYSMYGHIQSNGFVKVGDTVKKRQQIGIIGDPVTFGPHLHFEIKNRTALVSPPFSGCSQVANGIYISAGYSGKRNDFAGGDFWDPSNDGVSGNLYYHPTRFIRNRLSTALSP
jgi:murein DD-endopeptidase MepM/ murein hydrolase activator NlpD